MSLNLLGCLRKLGLSSWNFDEKINKNKCGFPREADNGY
jgi:hypothetical protein